eukprot:CAMPEP_0113507786 /NCGR_PEP_ID=MMETSP0014_2-20120614/36655_1 /TAXON_ID=2857 /ORGANISM="Nitzschia sp." /LENGTH=48 /DNA_ID=CAMNT_0000403427 /DNA_START=42 /DNA_END=184 /DNA_ORIENTATION=+ /assembly_acc=CAM_ASM_000159
MEEEEEEEGQQTTSKKKQKTVMKVSVAVVGIGWWSQGWHLPFLDKCRR